MTVKLRPVPGDLMERTVFGFTADNGSIVNVGGRVLVCAATYPTADVDDAIPKQVVWLLANGQLAHVGFYHEYWRRCDG